MNTKVIVALIIVGVLAIAVVGLVSAQIATSTPNGTTANRATNNGFFGWMGRCFGFREAQPGTGTSIYQSLPANIVTDPNKGTTPTNQGYTGYGRCMGFKP